MSIQKIQKKFKNFNNIRQNYNNKKKGNNLNNNKYIYNKKFNYKRICNNLKYNKKLKVRILKILYFKMKVQLQLNLIQLKIIVNYKILKIELEINQS